jgi:putative phosphoribosyl transferase
MKASIEQEVLIPAGTASLQGDLRIPPASRGVVIFAHGSGSGRKSPRNRRVAWWLEQAGLGTLLFDLLTSQEDGDRSKVFDIPFLAGRLLTATAWLREAIGARMPAGFFGASTGAAAALWAAAEAGQDVRAIVSRGGRPDLAGGRLRMVTAPTLLIVGELDRTVLDLNRAVQSELRCPNELVVVPGASHLFEERGALDDVARLAAEWFKRHFAPSERPARSTA